MQVFAQPFLLLEEIYHQAREKRAQLTAGVAQEYQRVGLYKNNSSMSISNISSLDIDKQDNK